MSKYEQDTNKMIVLGNDTKVNVEHKCDDNKGPFVVALAPDLVANHSLDTSEQRVVGSFDDQTNVNNGELYSLKTFSEQAFEMIYDQSDKAAKDDVTKYVYATGHNNAANHDGAASHASLKGSDRFYKPCELDACELPATYELDQYDEVFEAVQSSPKRSKLSTVQLSGENTSSTSMEEEADELVDEVLRDDLQLFDQFTLHAPQTSHSNERVVISQIKDSEDRIISITENHHYEVGIDEWTVDVDRPSSVDLIFNDQAGDDTSDGSDSNDGNDGDKYENIDNDHDSSNSSYHSTGHDSDSDDYESMDSLELVSEYDSEQSDYGHLISKTDAESQNNLDANTEQDDESINHEQLTLANDIMASIRKVGPIAYAEQQLQLGECAAKLLSNLGFKLPEHVQKTDLTSQWNFVKRFLLRYIYQRQRHDSLRTFDDAVELVQRSTNIMFVTGAGISVSCGIPDFRSDDGLYAKIRDEYQLPEPECMFDIEYFRIDPKPFYSFAKEICPGKYIPSKSHRFIRTVEVKGKLLRDYTQNIDTLEAIAGIEKVIYCHGSFASATCVDCRHKISFEELKRAMEIESTQSLPWCSKCSEGIFKPDIVFFGEPLPNEFDQSLDVDVDKIDLLIVIGSSLKVHPVSMIPDLIPPHVPQILINRESLDHNFDIELLGNCDEILAEMSRRLGWGVEMDLLEEDEKAFEFREPNITLFSGHKHKYSEQVKNTSYADGNYEGNQNNKYNGGNEYNEDNKDNEEDHNDNDPNNDGNEIIINTLKDESITIDSLLHSEPIKAMDRLADHSDCQAKDWVQIDHQMPMECSQIEYANGASLPVASLESDGFLLTSE